MAILISSIVIMLTSMVIFYAGNFFAKSSSAIGDYLRLSRSVKGATFDAVSSSLPELLVALFAVIIFKKFEVGIGTIAGSALFNLLIIPGICVLVAPVAFKVSREVIFRDSLFYIVSVLILLGALIWTRTWGLIIPIIFILGYVAYVSVIIRDTHRHRKRNKPVAKKISLHKETAKAIISMTIIAVATYFLTEHAILLSEALHISPVIIAFTVIAAATSVPDAVISITNAKRGDIDDAASNVFGSNVFDIFLGIGIPMLIAFFIAGPVDIIFDNLEIVIGLFLASILVFVFMSDGRKLTKREGWFMLGIYALFFTYIIYLALI